MSIVLTTFSSIVNYVLRDIQNMDLRSSILKGVDEALGDQQAMIEQSYISPLRTFQDYIKNGMYEDGMHSLMELSNRDATPKINYLLALTLAKCDELELAKDKLKKAFIMNPYLQVFQPHLNMSYLFYHQPTPSWCVRPYTIVDSFSNKALRRLGIEVNEGIAYIEVCSSGGDILYLISTESECVFELLEITSGRLLWQHNVSDLDYRIITCTPEYAVFQDGTFYKVYNKYGSCVGQYSKSTFETIFSSKEELKMVDQYKISCNINEYTEKMRLSTLTSKHLSITPVKYTKHKYWKTDGNQPHPGIEFDPVVYWAMNVDISLD